MDEFDGDQEEEDIPDNVIALETEPIVNRLMEVKANKTQGVNNSPQKISVDLLNLFLLQLYNNPKGEKEIPEMKPQSSISEDETDFRLANKLD